MNITEQHSVDCVCEQCKAEAARAFAAAVKRHPASIVPTAPIKPLPTEAPVPRPLSVKKQRKLAAMRREAEGGYATTADLLRLATTVNGRRLRRA